MIHQNGERPSIDFRALMGPVALKLYGEPNAKLSKPNELRWGSHGGRIVYLESGSFVDTEAGERGGTLDLLRHEAGLDKAQAMRWLSDNGLIDQRPAQGGGSSAVRLNTGQRIVATFNFVKDGAIQYRKHRIEPGREGRSKEFFYDHPDGNGGWSSGRGGAKQVPYRLDQLLSSKGPVVMAEGEKQADKLASWDFVATSIKDWLPDFMPSIAGRPVVILPDNDDDGRKQALRMKKLAEEAGCSVRVIDLPGLPPKGDIMDWGGSRADLAALVDAACSTSNNITPRTSDWKPVDLWARYEAPPLPEHILPPVVERFAVAQGHSMGVDPGGLVMSALAVCAAATSDRIRLQVKRFDPTWLESARLWVALIGTPSTKKTPMMSAAMRPLHKIDTQLFREYTIKQEIYEALPAKEKKTSPKPAQRRLRISDATVEAAQEVLKDSPDGVLSQQDELSGWFGAMDKYSAGKGAMADRSFWLQSFNGGSYALNRVSRGAALIPNLSICVLGGIQPDPLRRIVDDAVDDGLIQRLLPVILKPAVLGKDEPQDDSVRQYDELVNRLWALSPPPGSDGDGVLRFSDEAQLIRRRLEERHLEMAAAEVISPKLASHFGKYDGIFARLCVLWHCIEYADAPSLPATIHSDTAQRVADFLHGYIVPNAIAFYSSVLGLSDDHGTLIELATYILAHRLETVQHRDTQRANATLKALTADQSRRLFEKLEALSWLEPTAPPPNSSTPRWQVNPAVHELFAERGRREKERRERARAAIMSVLKDPA